ncbi:MAG TPA: hypothetical protein DGG95_18240 [Cytophagales bacterium]|jgi:CheY-like chemotaxis protein|nr:hypothetical protein [Cytophagales bacterium]
MTNILLIEDNPEIRENITEILELASYNVIAAVNGKEGVALMKHHQPDLILCDVWMPEMNGHEVFNFIKLNPATAKTPFVFVTASAEKKEMDEAIARGADGYICKPFDTSDLLNIIESCLS